VVGFLWLLVRARAPVVSLWVVVSEWEPLNSGEGHQWAKAHFYFELEMALEIEKVREICDRVAGSLGLEIADIEFKGGAGKQGRLLRIFIDRPYVPGQQQQEESEASVNGVTLEDCANVSREVSTILDVEDVIPGAEYTLEVSSPGLDRKLSRVSDYQRFTGSMVKIMTREPVGVTEKSKGNRHWEGRLTKFEGNTMTLDVSAGRKKQKGQKQAAAELVEIELGNVEKANLVPEI
jgi:ribosome maturation factor RimP